MATLIGGQTSKYIMETAIITSMVFGEQVLREEVNLQNRDISINSFPYLTFFEELQRATQHFFGRTFRITKRSDYKPLIFTQAFLEATNISNVPVEI